MEIRALRSVADLSISTDRGKLTAAAKVLDLESKLAAAERRASTHEEHIAAASTSVIRSLEEEIRSVTQQRDEAREHIERLSAEARTASTELHLRALEAQRAHQMYRAAELSSETYAIIPAASELETPATSPYTTSPRASPHTSPPSTPPSAPPSAKKSSPSNGLGGGAGHSGGTSGGGVAGGVYGGVRRVARWSKARSLVSTLRPLGDGLPTRGAWPRPSGLWVMACPPSLRLYSPRG